MKKNILAWAGALALATLFVLACNDEREQTASTTNLVRLTAVMSGAAEKPTPNASTATGQFTGVLDRTTRVLSYTVTYSGLSPVMGHVHRITPNVTNGTGPVEVPFPSLGSPIISTVTLASQSRVDSMLNGFYYANLHTTAFPAGEIRGDIRPVDNIPVLLTAAMSGAAEKPTPNASMATGQFTGSLDRTTRTLSYTVTYSGLSPVMGHLHRITPNTTAGVGPVEIPFKSLTSPIIETAVLATQSRVDSLIQGLYYANLHTTAFPAGEIRGDIRVK